ncbi:hypothetical protein RB600_005924 [Gaeumannomyces tritici]
MEAPETLVPIHAHDASTNRHEVSSTSQAKNHSANDAATTIILPDLFVSIMSPSPRLNPLYEVVRPASEAFTKELLGLDAASFKKHHRVNFSLLASMWMPEADAEGLRVMVDWLTWVFFFDDLFDDGELRDDPVGAQAEAEATLALMSDHEQEVSRELHPLRYLFYTTWVRFRNRSSKALQTRYRKCIEEYITGVVRQTGASLVGADISVEQYLHWRRKSVGLRPCHALMEYACGIQLPDYVLAHPAVQECVMVSIDLVSLQNDILSYRKELASCGTQNIIHILRRQGMTTQQAFDRAGGLTVTAIRRWHLAQLDMPIWGEEVDRQLQRYLQGCLDSCIGSLNWSTGRYFGDEGDVIRKTRCLSLDYRYGWWPNGLGAQ